MPLTVLLLGSFLFTVGAVVVFRHCAALHIIDFPKRYGTHSKPVTRGGGIGFIVTFFLINIAIPSLPLHIWIPLGVLAGIGFIDDFREVHYVLRLVVQSIVAAYLFSHSNIAFLFEQHAVSFPLQLLVAAACIVVIMAYINFYNFMDGVDGLVASAGALQLIFIGIVLGEPFWFLFAAALAGFLVWNLSPKKIFMGDAGSTFLGALAIFSIIQPTHSLSRTWPLIIVTLPIIADAGITLISRMVKRKNIFEAHTDHLYQRLYRLGWSQPRISALYACATVLLGAITLYATQWTT